MQLSAAHLCILADLACQAAIEAGALISSYRNDEVSVSQKEGGDSLASQVVTEVDLRSQAIVMQHIEPSLKAYDLGLLTEELPDDGSRHRKDFFWCIDPLDGTLPFTQGIPGYSVSIAMVDRQGMPVIGVVYDPVTEKLYRAVDKQGVVINGKPWSNAIVPKMNEQRLGIYCDCTFETEPKREQLVERWDALALELGYAGVVVHIGGGGVLNACWVMEHSPACYYKQPKQEEGGGSFWDFAATACLFQESGLHVSDYSGETLNLNQSGSTFMNTSGVCYATDAEIAHALRRNL